MKSINQIHFKITDEEKKKIKEYAIKSKLTITDFIRQSILEKIKQMENIEEIERERESTLHSMKLNLALINHLKKSQDLRKEEEGIINLLKIYGPLNSNQITERINLDKDIIFQIISNDKLFELTNEGKFKLKKD